MASKKKRILAVAAGVVLASTALAACGSDDDGGGGSGGGGDAEKGGTLYFVHEDPIDHWDPQRTYVGTDISKQSRLVYRSLVTFGTSTDDSASTPLPDLATDAGTDVDGDGKVWEFTLRDGVNWQDGKPVTCEDLKYGASRNFATDVITGGPAFYVLSYLDIPTAPDGSSQYKGPYSGEGQELFDKAVTCDGNTITYRFNKPWPDFPLAVAALHMFSPYREDVDQGNASNYAIMSNGPYMLEGEWDKQSGGTFVRNPEYDPATDETDSRKALRRGHRRQRRRRVHGERPPPAALDVQPDPGRRGPVPEPRVAVRRLPVVQHREAPAGGPPGTRHVDQPRGLDQRRWW
jgi:peptide/nickel transport system substrate-binding protein